VATISEVKEALQGETGIPAASQVLSRKLYKVEQEPDHASRGIHDDQPWEMTEELEDDGRTLADLGIRQDFTLLHLRIKKKGNSNTPGMLQRSSLKCRKVVKGCASSGHSNGCIAYACMTATS
jgi:hypothetical protein